MIAALMIVGIMAAMSIDSQKPAHTNYSLVALAAVCFGLATYIEVVK